MLAVKCPRWLRYTNELQQRVTQASSSQINVRSSHDGQAVAGTSRRFQNGSGLSNGFQRQLGGIPVSSLISLDSSPPKKAKVVICGGGTVGIALLYHLAELGLGDDSVLIEQGSLGDSLTWQASGMIGGVQISKVAMDIIRSSVPLVEHLTAAGHDVGWKQCGSLNLARTRDRLTYLRKLKAIAEARGTECYMLKKDEVKDKCEIMETSDILGALWLPEDGVCDTFSLCLALLKEAIQKGGHATEDCILQRTIVQNHKVVAVETSKGIIECDYFVNAGGFWARKIGQMVEPHVKVPIHPAEHYYLYTHPVEGIDSMPVIHDPDGNVYIREFDGGFLAGGFEKVAKPSFEHGDLPENCYGRELHQDWDHFHVLLREMLHRIPIMGEAVLKNLSNASEGFSPDGNWIIGMAPEIMNYYVAAGLKSGSYNSACGIGQLLAQWIVTGHCVLDAYDVDILRFLPMHNNRKFLRDRVKEVPGRHYSLSYPFVDFESGRCLRMSPIFPKLKSAGAVFGQIMGYERPSYFIPEESEVYDGESDGEVEGPFRTSNTKTWTKPPWFNYVAEEYRACRETCAILDYSSFTKFDCWSKGEEVVDALQYLCSNDVDIPVGGIIHTGMQNHLGGYENDCSLVRIAPNHYMMIAPSIQQSRCGSWLRKNLPSDGSVVIKDITSMYTAICLMGPQARSVMADLTDSDLSTKGFPFFSFKEIDVGLANGIRAMNITHTGELGWVLYIPNEFALHIYNNLVNKGKAYGMCHAGYYAMRSLRIEKFYAFWGQDLDSSTTPLECGRGFRVKLHKDIDFIGRSALQQQASEGVKRMYVQLVLEDHDPEVDPWPWGGEPIYRNGQYVGVTTTTGYGFTLNNMVCLGFVRKFNSNNEMDFVTTEYVMEGSYEVNIAGVKYAASVGLHSRTLPTKYPEPQSNRYLATQL
ncbi:pyruvate dehydrogenase phosphatase regulatory subunit, mitochondrial [Oratosquilla oratoria]|uniref:pyruvate dehydrogenase phosphatase regulatory subunit, mitochondrial n=1 Tax=Oratosquilla oratoria TaxID=337810 RepID=UPI003F76C6B5